MNENNFDERSTPAEVAEKADQVMNGTAINSDPFVDEVPVDNALIHETPMGGTVAAVDPMKETVNHPLPVAETIPNQVQILEPAPYATPVVVEKITPAEPVVTNNGSSMGLLTHEVSDPLRMRWNEIQGNFIDDPRNAVQQADTLVSDVIREITLMLTHEHNSIEGQWKQDQDISTENLRKSLQLYRTYFNRLVS